MALRFSREPYIDIYLSCGDKEEDCNLVGQLLSLLERVGYSCFFRLRDGDVQLRIETARGTIPRCSLLLAFASKHSVQEDCQYSQYEMALAMDFRRQILLVALDDVKIPSLFKNVDTLTGRMDQPFDDWTKKILKGVKNKIHSQPKPYFELNLVKEFLWNIEGKAFFDLMESHSKTVNAYISEIAWLKKRNNNLIHIRLQECEDLETANQRLGAQVKEMQEKLSDRNLCPYSYAAEIAAQCVKYQRENEQMSAEIRRLRGVLEKKDHGSAAEGVSSSEGELVDCFYKALSLGANRRSRSDLNTTSALRRVPSEVAAFFHRYQGLIGYDEITALGRELGLTCSQLDEIDGYRSVGLTEMFWQMCRQYSTGQSDTCSVQNMMDALAKIGVNIEGRPMNTEEKSLLAANLDYIYKNMKDVVILLPLLLKKDAISTDQALYVETPRSCRQRVERLIEVLVTKETGYARFCEVLELSGQTCLAEYLRNVKGKSEIQTSVKAPYEHEEEARDTSETTFY